MRVRRYTKKNTTPTISSVSHHLVVSIHLLRLSGAQNVSDSASASASARGLCTTDPENRGMNLAYMV